MLLGINSDEDRAAIQKTIKAEKLAWRSFWDQRPDGPIHAQWQITLRPTIHLLDAQGVIRHKDVDPAELDALIDRMLAQHAEKSRKRK